MATYDFVKRCDKYKIGTFSNGTWSWGNWQDTNEGGSAQIATTKDGGNITYRKDILFRCPSTETGTINALQFSPYFLDGFSDNGWVKIEIYDTDPSAGSATPIATEYEEVQAGWGSGTVAFYISTPMDVSADRYIRVWYESNRSPSTVTQHVEAYLSCTLHGTFGDLALNITPGTISTAEGVKLDFTNRCGETLILTCKSGSTTLYTDTVNEDSVTLSPTNAWFATLGTSSTSMSVNVTVSGDSKTVSGSFTLKEALVVTATSPKNTTRTASSSMAYSWSLSGRTSQTEAQVQYRTGSTWYSLGTVSGSSTTLYSSVRPSAGTVYWRVRVKNNLDCWSAWSSEVSFTLQYNATSYLSPYSTSTSGYLNRASAQKFRVEMKANGTPQTDFYIKSGTAVFSWRTSTSGAWTNVDMAYDVEYGSTVKTRATVTIPANTFPKGDLYWKVEAQDQYGTTRSCGPYSMSTVVPALTSVALSPIDTIETRNTPTEFRWQSYSSSGGYAGAELQYSTDGTTWNPLGTVSGNVTTFTAEANALPSGLVYWRVRSVNTDDVWGAWSSVVSFTNFGAPSVNSIAVNDRPYTTVTWGTSTQESYKVIVGSETYGPYFGPDVRAFTLPEPLEDGSHHAGVMVQNEYGQWSEPLETDFTIANVPGTDITLSVTAGIDAALFWSAGDDTEDYVVYRDGKAIGHTDQTNFLDRVCLGAHEWHVLERLPDGYYTKSNVVSGVLALGAAPKIALLSGGDWLSLDYSENSRRTYRIEETQEISEKAVMGAEYPEVEVSPYKSLSVGMDAAWLMSNLGFTVLRSLVGKALILKLPHNVVVIGVLRGYSGKHGKRIGSYEYTLRQMRWRDYINA